MRSLLFAVIAFFPSIAFAQAIDDAITWPPEEIAKASRENLLERIDTLNTLAERLQLSPYNSVRRSESSVISASYSDREAERTNKLPDSESWRQLLDASGFSGVVKAQDEVHFIHLPPDLTEVQGTAFSYIYIRSDERHLPTCVPEFREYSCGQCALKPESGWTIQFAWLPAEDLVQAEDELRGCIGEFTSETGVAVGAEKDD